MTTTSGGYVADMPAAAAAAGGGSNHASPSPSSSSPSSSDGGAATTTCTTTSSTTTTTRSSSSSQPSPITSATSISVTNSSSSPLLTIVPAVHGSPTRAGSASPSGSVGDVTVGGMGVTATHLTAQVVVASSAGTASSTASSTVSLPKGTIISADSPHLIIGAVSEGDGSLDSSSGVGVHGAYVQYVDASPDPLYSSTNGQM